jgi:hypothetical protein
MGLNNNLQEISNGSKLKLKSSLKLKDKWGKPEIKKY